MVNMKYDIRAMRKAMGLNQKDFASRIGIRQSFLSAIENGKSPLPADKEKNLSTIFPEINVADFLAKSDVHNHSHDLHESAGPSETHMLTELLSYFHDQAHKEKDEHHEMLHMQMNSFQERNDRLTEKNEALQTKIDALTLKIEKLNEELIEIKNENLRLKELLLLNGLNY